MADKIGNSISNELGYFGNIWVRSHLLPKAGDENGGGHLHPFDHVTMLHKGRIRADVTDPETGEMRSKEFTAPTSAATMLALDGKNMSGVTVAKRMRSISFGSVLLFASISLTALTAITDTPWFSPFKILLSLTPVRLTIHSSLVSTMVSSS